MYNQLQSQCQGSRTVNDYAEEFFLLLSRTENYDSAEQLFSRFIRVMHLQLQNSLSQFNLTTAAEAHRRAASFEKQQRSSSWGRLGKQNKTPLSEEGDAPKTSSRLTSLKCYSCGEPGHHLTTCPNHIHHGLIATARPTSNFLPMIHTDKKRHIKIM